MTRERRQIVLAFMAVFFAAMLSFFLANLHLADEVTPPRDLTGMAKWMTEHPADWLTASMISDRALDSKLPRRRELWRSSYELAHHLAPRRRNPTAGFVRGGFQHWQELNAADRQAVLTAAAPLLRDPAVFDELHQPLWRLTHDFTYLRRNAPQTVNALDSLRNLAVSNGLFAEYRDIRAAQQRQSLAAFDARANALTPGELLALLPARLDSDAEPLIRRVLQELQTRSYEAPELGGRIDDVVDYAIRHGLGPLEGLAPLIESPRLPAPLRARLAIALGDANAATRIEMSSALTGAGEWVPYHLARGSFEARRGDAAAADVYLRRAAVSGTDARVLAAAEEIAVMLHNTSAAARAREQLIAASRDRTWNTTCSGRELCDWARTRVYAAKSISIDAEVAQTDQVPPYVEIYVDDARVAEGAINGERRFVIPVRAGLHDVEVRLMNRVVRPGIQRRVRLS